VVSDPHVASVIDYETGENQGQPWVASTLVRGPSLAAAVAETGPLPAAVGWIALGLADALATLHGAGLSHHAVTPGNTLLGLDGPVLTDFGVSRTALLAGPGTPADDVRALGATVFFAAAGRSPDDWDLTGCPPWLAPIVRACLAPDPAARPGAAHLHAWLADEVGQQPRSWLPGPVAARVAEYQSPRAGRARFRWPPGTGSVTGV
jgi:serine/threonine protein kinase